MFRDRIDGLEKFIEDIMLESAKHGSPLVAPDLHDPTQEELRSYVEFHHPYSSVDAPITTPPEKVKRIIDELNGKVLPLGEGIQRINVVVSGLVTAKISSRGNSIRLRLTTPVGHENFWLLIFFDFLN